MKPINLVQFTDVALQNFVQIPAKLYAIFLKRNKRPLPLILSLNAYYCLDTAEKSKTAKFRITFYGF